MMLDYVSLTSTANHLEWPSCNELAEMGADPRVILLLREDGSCDAAPIEVAPAAPTWPEGGVGWNEAANLVGTYQRVCGPYATTRGTPAVVFVNIGADHPNPNRFTFVIWGDWWLDPLPPDAVICASGYISTYEGVLQMELESPGELEIWT